MTAIRILVLGNDPALTSAIVGILAAELPHAACDAIDPAGIRSRPNAAALVIDARAGNGAAAGTVRRVRAMGFDGPVLLVGFFDAARGDGTDGARMGYVMVRPDALAERLMPALEEQLALAAAPCTDQVTHARRLVAAGEIAVGLQHALNNPLAGIMAEAQLMQLESPSPDQAAALERIVTLCRRMVDLTHALDGVGSKKR